MPIPVTCTCGKKFAAKDGLAGKRLKCPACGGVVTIPASQAASPPPVAPPETDPLFASDPFGSPASSGDAFDLGSLSGFDASGTASAPLASGAPTTFSAAGYGAPGAAAAATQCGTAPPSGGLDFGMKLALFGGGAAIVLLGGAFCIYVAVSTFSAPVVENATAPIVILTPPAPPATPAPAATPPSTPPASSPAFPAPSLSPPAFPGVASPAKTPESGTAEPNPEERPRVPAGTPAASPKNTSGKPLPQAVLGWQGQQGASLLGAKPVRGEELYVYQYSWLCDVLPFLGYEKLYNEFDFQRPWTSDPNLTRTRYIIPQFLNPSDSRVGWKGYPFHGSVLTHFAGLSGIEDSRNVVAAELPRTDPRAGVFGYHGSAHRDEITDGTSNTLMIIGSGELAGLWVQGGGATIRGAREPYFDPLSGFGSRGAQKPGAMAMLADGSVRHIPASIDPRVFRALTTIAGGETVDLAPLGPALSDFPAKQ